MTTRRCAATNAAGLPCGAPPLTDEAMCLWHSTVHSDEVDEARRLGGLRRRREKVLVVNFDLETLHGIEGLGRILEIVVFDLLALERSMGRARTLLAAIGIGLKLIDVGDHEVRLVALEAALKASQEREGGQ